MSPDGDGDEELAGGLTAPGSDVLARVFPFPEIRAGKLHRVRADLDGEVAEFADGTLGEVQGQGTVGQHILEQGVYGWLARYAGIIGSNHDGIGREKIQGGFDVAVVQRG